MTERLFNNLENKPESEKEPPLNSLHFEQKANFLNVSFILDGEKYEVGIEISEEDKRQRRSFFEIFLNFLNVSKDTPLIELPAILRELAEEIKRSKENV